jgi:hypothetical protein
MNFTNAGIVQATTGTLGFDPLAIISNYSSTTNTLSGGIWKATSATLDFGGRHISTIAANTTVELSGTTANMNGLFYLTQNNGLLRIYNSASLTLQAPLSTTGVTEATGTLAAAAIVQNGGVLTGKGTVTGLVTLQSGGQISPGPGPYNANGAGVLTVAALIPSGNSIYAWEINSWSSAQTAGNNYDQIKGAPAAYLNLSGVNSGNPVVIKIISINGTTPAQIPTFDPSMARTWVIADFSSGNPSGGIISYAASKFTLDTSQFQNAPNTTQFTLSTDANTNKLILTYTPAPEPKVLLVSIQIIMVIWLAILRIRKP